jgi:hypothetical protein
VLCGDPHPFILRADFGGICLLLADEYWLIGLASWCVAFGPSNV